ncbi:hypothetical protein P7K49_000005, partial [Saguinus oedipus]
VLRHGAWLLTSAARLLTSSSRRRFQSPGYKSEQENTRGVSTLQYQFDLKK